MTQPLPEPVPGNTETAAAPESTAASAPARDLNRTIGSHFKMIFLVIVGFTVMFWLAHFGLLLFTVDPERPEIKDALETTKIAGFSGLGTIFGLLGGAVGGKL
ncbi:hypothetical protein ACH4PU_14790 [Streptomyces sp. NPDC021100]|uniref:hypothetical protein n=1 Tax=Streptomyces sp. NPDC021100 TaxID=3365114 RepID=UPI00379D736B